MDFEEGDIGLAGGGGPVVAWVWESGGGKKTAGSSIFSVILF